jgi:hypothetical protein
MDEDGDLKNGIGIEMDQFNLVVIKVSMEEITGNMDSGGLIFR